MSSEIINSDSESTLISIAKWGIFSVKIPGYFPLSVNTSSVNFLSHSKFEKRQYLSFSYCSAAAMYSMILLGILSCWDLIFFARQSSFHKYLKARGPTEIYAYTLMLAISSLLGIYITIFGLRKAPKFLKYWKDTCTIFDQLQSKLALNLNIGLENDNDPGSSSKFVIFERFYAIEKSIRNSFLTLIIPIIIHVLIDYGYRIADSFLHEDGTSEDTQLAIGLGVWTFFALAGSGISIWMVFFIQLYTACLLAISDSVRGLSVSSIIKNNISPQLNMSTDNVSRRKGSSFVVDEMFSRVILQSHPLPRNDQVEKTSRMQSDLESTLDTYLFQFQSILKGIEQFNEFFGVILIFEISVCVLNLLVYLFFALVWLGRGEVGLLMETAVPIYIYGKELYDVGSFSEELTAAADSVIKAFGHLPLSGLTPHMHLKLQMLATQISTNPPAISAKQFFLVNRSLVTAVLSGLATFLVVLVQFRDADDAGTATSSTPTPTATTTKS